jgi:hypothetical protein
MAGASLLLDLSHVDVGNGLLAVEDLGNFFEGRAFGLNIAASHQHQGITVKMEG